MTFKELLDLAAGKTGRLIDQAGQALGNPFPEVQAFGDQGLSGALEYQGSQPLSTEERINTSLENTGGIAEGDYATAVDMGLPYSPSRADGGILTTQQQTSNSSAADQYLKDQGITDLNTLNPVQREQYEKLTAPTGGGDSGDGGLGAQIALARAAYENAVGGLQNAFGEARGVYDQGIGLVNKRRGEFKDIYNQGNADILNSFEGERGNLQRSSVGNQQRLRNILRATGMGGSALVRGIGSQDKSNLRNLGALSNEKTFNERENLGGYNKNQEWAGQQESSLGNFLQAAQNRLQEGIGKAGLVQQGDVSGINNAYNDLRSNIFDQKAALQAAQGGIGSYAVNPFAPNLSDMSNSLNLSLPSFATNGGGGSADQAVSLAPENMSYLDKLRARAGGSLYA